MFRNTTETPLTVGLSLHCYHSTRSEKLLDLLPHAGTGVSYKQTMNIVNRIACAVHENISSNDGVYVPPFLLKFQPLRAAIDNIDAKVDTPDGKKTFHALAGSVYQANPNPGQYATRPFKLDIEGNHSLRGVPQTKLQN